MTCLFLGGLGGAVEWLRRGLGTGGRESRFLPDGNVEFVDRGENQVSIRSFRVDLGEVEAVLKQHSSVAEAAVSINECQGEQIIAHIVVRRQHAFSTTELRNFLKTRLPDHMIPTAIVTLDALPLTPSGKLDRKALVLPSFIRQADIGYIAPSTWLEERLADFWTEILDIDRVGVHDDFFDLGGHSLSTTQVVSRIREVFVIDLPLRTLFEKRTIAELAATISETQHDGVASKELPAIQSPFYGRERSMHLKYPPHGIDHQLGFVALDLMAAVLRHNMFGLR